MTDRPNEIAPARSKCSPTGDEAGARDAGNAADALTTQLAKAAVMAETKHNVRFSKARTEYTGGPPQSLAALAKRHGLPVRALRERAGAEDWNAQRLAAARAWVAREEQGLADVRSASLRAVERLTRVLGDPAAPLRAVRKAAGAARLSTGRLYCAVGLVRDATARLAQVRRAA